MIKRPKLRERRQFVRCSTLVHGWICAKNRPRISCRLQNISGGGALLKFSSPNKFPKDFILYIEAIDTSIGCSVRHERDDMLGVQFRPVEGIAKSRPSGNAPGSVYEKLLALESGQHTKAECTERINTVV